MKTTLLLFIIYLAFISLGLPDSLLGPAWPKMYGDLGVPVHYAGVITMIMAAATVVSSLMTDRLIKRFGVAKITVFSVLLTAVALLGFSYSKSFFFICLLALPLGLGAGCIDAALNNYVALHYKAKHMNWLHCFWGVGAALGPLIMAHYLDAGQSWQLGYNSVGWLQTALVIVLIISIPLWVNGKGKNEEETHSEEKTDYTTLVAIPGVKPMLIIFFCYCTIETTFGLWGASYLVISKNLSVEYAAQMVALYYGGITLGRFFSGFLTTTFTNNQLVRLGQLVIALGLILLFFDHEGLILSGFLLVGIGCAPIFPSLLHETPRNFGEKYSQAIMGVQMASAYVGITLMPLTFGKLASYLSYSFLLWFLLGVLIVKAWLFSMVTKVV